MLMLTIQTFLLLLIPGLIGLVVGHLLACGGAGEIDWSDDRPWLRDTRAMPASPNLPTAPTLLDPAERARLTASLAEANPTAGSADDAVAAATAAADAAAAKVAAEAKAVEDAAAAKAAAEADAAKAAAAAKAAEDAAAAKAAEDAAAAKAAADAEAAKLAAEAKAAEDAAAAAAAEAEMAFALPPEVAAAAVAPTVAPEDADRAAAADAVGTRPLALAAPMGGKADDLKRIRGIGPANEKKLHGLGVYHFSQIAAWSAENAKWAGSFMAFPGRIEREEWIAQAKVLATGAETAFSKRVDAGEVPTSQSKPS